MDTRTPSPCVTTAARPSLAALASSAPFPRRAAPAPARGASAVRPAPGLFAHRSARSATASGGASPYAARRLRAAASPPAVAQLSFVSPARSNATHHRRFSLRCAHLVICSVPPACAPAPARGASAVRPAPGLFARPRSLFRAVLWGRLPLRRRAPPRCGLPSVRPSVFRLPFPAPSDFASRSRLRRTPLARFALPAPSDFASRSRLRRTPLAGFAFPAPSDFASRSRLRRTPLARLLTFFVLVPTAARPSLAALAW